MDPAAGRRLRLPPGGPGAGARISALPARIQPGECRWDRNLNGSNAGRGCAPGGILLLRCGLRRTGSSTGREDAIPNPRSPYAVSKLSAEYYVRTIGQLWGIETVSLRVFNTYGPGQHLPPVHAPVIPNFIRQAAMSGTLVVHGDGQQTRDYVYITDVVNAMVAASSAPDVNQAIINVGSGRGTTIRELVRLVRDVTGGEFEVVYNPRNDRGPSQLSADISLAQKKLSYQPMTSLEAGLRLTYELDRRLRK
jgi:UDP-glucose 4-epimerase